MILAYAASKSGGLANNSDKNDNAQSHPPQMGQPVYTSKAIWTRGLLLHNRTQGQRAQFQIQPYHLLAVCSCLGHFIPPSLNFSICNAGSRGCCKDEPKCVGSASSELQRALLVLAALTISRI